MKVSRLVTSVAAALALMGQGALALARPCLCATAPASVAACCCGPASDAPTAHGCCSAPAQGDAAPSHCGDEGGRCARELLGDLSGSAATSSPVIVAPAGSEPSPAFLPVEVEPPQPALRVGRAAESPPPPLLALKVARITVLRI